MPLLSVLLLVAQNYVFGPGVRVNDGPAGEFQARTSSPGQHLVAVRHDTVYLVWEDTRDLTCHVRFARSNDAGRSFTGHAQLDRSYIARGPSLHVDAGGDLHVTWVAENEESERHVNYARSTDGGLTFSPPLRADDSLSPGRCASASVAAFRTGRFVAVARDDDYQIRFSLSTDGGGTFPGPNLRLDDNPGGSMSPTIAVLRDSIVLVVWTSLYYDDVYLVRSTDGGHSFSAPLSLSRPHWAMDACVAADDSGRVYVLTVGDSLRLTVSEDGGESFPPLTALPGTDRVQQAGLLAAGPGRLLLAWSSYHRARPDSVEVHFAASDDAGAGFSLPVDPSDGLPDDNEKWPALAAGEPGTVFCAWTDTRSCPGRFAGDVYLAAGTMTGVAEPNHLGPISGGIQLSPNPVRDGWLTLSCLPSPDPARLAIYDAAGRRVRELTVTRGSNPVRCRVDVGGLPAGAYFVRPEGEHGSAWDFGSGCRSFRLLPR